MNRPPIVEVADTHDSARELLIKYLAGDVVGFVLMMHPRRPGVRAFMTFLEFRHFAPRGGLNHEFVLCRIIWEEMLFFVAIIPKAKRSLADGIMAELGMRAANGVPHVITGKGQAHFPVDVPNLFTLEPIAGHFIYHNDPKLEKSAAQFEDEACERILAEDAERRKASHRL